MWTAHVEDMYDTYTWRHEDMYDMYDMYLRWLDGGSWWRLWEGLSLDTDLAPGTRESEQWQKHSRLRERNL